ncbi:MAG: EFR1 family ferrodoxin [Acidaminococcales bacterium]|jgi:2-oxoglutarate ferredoxin oxidoreductase subunit delta|nr:EFR1 family ferrodoxin [Acidaminococcales bacterium]
MDSKQADIYVFSGSGNTFLLAETVADILSGNNCQATLHPIGRFSASGPERALGIAFPVACMSTYPFIIEFLRSLPPGNGREAFHVGSMAANSFGMQEPIRKLLVNKGYRPIGSRVLKMPSNYGKNLNPKSLSNQNVIKEAIVQAANFAGQLLTGKSRWERIFAPWSGFFHNLAGKDKPWRLFKKMFPLKINKKYCVKCGFCQKICPAASIGKDADGSFYIADTCVSCQHCAAFCPQQAIGIDGESGKAYKVVEYSHLEQALRQ